MEILVKVAEVTPAGVMFNLVSSLARISKFVPVRVTAVAAKPTLGVKLVIVGAPLDAVTVNEALLVADPLGAVTLMEPVVAPDGTVTTNCVAVAEVTVADVPLKLTES